MLYSVQILSFEHDFISHKNSTLSKNIEIQKRHKRSSSFKLKTILPLGVVI